MVTPQLPISSSFGDLVITQDGSLTIKDPSVDECYHSTAGAAFEAETLYIHYSGFREALTKQTSLRVLDVGMGLAYNALSTIAAWAAADSHDCDLDLTSLEVNPALVAAIATGTAPWQAGWSAEWISWGKALLSQPDSATTSSFAAMIQHPSGKAVCHWRVLVGDAARLETAELGHSAGGYDFIWQDPFSPTRNPPLWTAEWFSKLKAISAPTALLMTYSVARLVRDHLTAAGWLPERFATGLQKRQWLRATLSLPA